VKQELQDIKNTSQELTHENENLEKLRAEKLEQFGLLSDTEDPLYKSYKKEIDDLEQKIETNKSTLEENKKKEIALEQQIATLK
jgi:septal ring factor EnvC (AmiA/AmiB activator)